MINNKEIKTKNIQFTVFADLHKKTAKSYDLSEDGMLIKGPLGNFFEGAFQSIELSPNELKEFLHSLESGYFLIQGIHQSLSDGCCPADATRSKEDFPFTDKPGIICIDTDSVDKFGIKSLAGLKNALEKIEPCLKNIQKVMSTSASSYIFIDEKEENSLRGIHTFIPIDTTLNNESILKILHIRSVIAGYAYPKVTKAGIIKINSLIDTALCTSNQPIFEGGAILKCVRLTQNRIIETFEGEVLQADSIPPLSDQEIAAYERVCNELKAKVKVEAEIARQGYTSKTFAKIKNRNNELTEDQALDVVNDAIHNSRLNAEFLILLESEAEITVQEILDNPKKYHEVPCAHPLNNEILGKSIIYSNQEKPLIYSFAHGGETFFLRPNTEEATNVDWRVELKEFVLDFNKTHAQVMIGGKHRIMRTVAAEIHPESRISYEFIKQEEIRKMYANEHIQIDEKINGQVVSPIFKDKITAWATHGDSKKYVKGVKFAPGKQLPADYYNSWQGFAIEPIPGANIDIIINHIELIICRGDRRLSEYCLNWIAYTVQNPDKPAGSALVLRGEKGSGKGTIGHFLRKIWGQHGMHISNSKHLIGNFNAHLADICYLFVDEAFYSGDKQHEGVLKALITEATITIERKGLDAKSHQNFLKIFMVTNNDYAVPASKDERRYCVFDVSSDRIDDRKYFKELHDACADEDVQSAFLYEMLNRDIKNFHIGAIPESQGLLDQRLASLNSIGKWFADSLTQGYFTDKDDNSRSWSIELTSEKLYYSYIIWCDSQRITYRETQNKVGRYLTKIFGKSRKLKNDERSYNLGPLYETISKFEKYEKVDLGLMADHSTVDYDNFECLNEKRECKNYNFGMIAEQIETHKDIKLN